MSDPSQKKPILAKAELTSSSLSYAFELQTLAAQAGFDWPDISGVVDKINEELNIFRVLNISEKLVL